MHANFRFSQIIGLLALICLCLLPSQPPADAAVPPISPPGDGENDPPESCQWCEVRIASANCWVVLGSPQLSWDLRKNCEATLLCESELGPGGEVVEHCRPGCVGEKCYIV